MKLRIEPLQQRLQWVLQETHSTVSEGPREVQCLHGAGAHSCKVAATPPASSLPETIRSADCQRGCAAGILGSDLVARTTALQKLPS